MYFLVAACWAHSATIQIAYLALFKIAAITVDISGDLFTFAILLYIHLYIHIWSTYQPYIVQFRSLNQTPDATHSRLALLVAKPLAQIAKLSISLRGQRCWVGYLNWNVSRSTANHLYMRYITEPGTASSKGLVRLKEASILTLNLDGMVPTLNPIIPFLQF